LKSNTTADNNTAVGYQAGYSNTQGIFNAFLGENSGYTNSTGQRNTYLGHYAGYSANANRNTFVGSDAGYLITSGSQNTIIGGFSGNQGGLNIVGDSNHIVISDGDGNPRLWFAAGGEPRIPRLTTSTTGNAANVWVSPTTGELVRSTSSLKYKRDVQDAAHGLSEVMQLRSVTYKGKSENDGETVFGGLIAEEVHDAGLVEFVQYNDEGQPDALAYGNMVSLCIKAIQDQQAIITALEARITALEAN
jgi:hypothetical protein